MDDKTTGAVIEGISTMASSSHDYVCAVTDRPRLGNHAVRWKRLIVSLITSIVQEPASALKLEGGFSEATVILTAFSVRAYVLGPER